MKKLEIDVYMRKVLIVFSCLFTIYCILYDIFSFATRAKYAATVLPLALIITLFNLYYNKKSIKYHPLKTVVIWIISIIMLISSIYYYSEFYTILRQRVANYNNFDYFFVFITIPLVIYLTFKTLGLIFGTVICLPFLLVIFGRYLPYPFTVSKISLKVLVAALSLDLVGIWGVLTQAMATYVGIFVIFAAAVRAFGGMESIVAFFIRLLGKNEVFFPQVATSSSMVFGSFSGSALGNVAGTGTFTIPMMKKRGIKPEYAAAVETVASAGGGIMPPIMGAGAFIMAEMLGVSYVKIIFAGFFPALIFYFTTFLNTHWVRLTQMRGELKNLEEKDNGQVEEQVKELERMYDPLILWCIVASMVVLMYNLLIGMSILRSGVRTVMSFYIFYFARLFVSIFISYIKKKQEHEQDIITELKLNSIDFVKKSVDFLNQAGKDVSELILFGAALGIISGTLLRTGLLFNLGMEIVSITRGNQYLLLLATIGLCLLLGMAVSALATYLLVVPLVVISFRELGVDPLIAHFIVFYLAAIAPLTPPIAPACALAAKIADADFVKTAKSSLLLAQGFILMPLVFLNYPSILNLDLVALSLLLGAMTSISIGLFVEFKEMKKIPNFLLIGLGLSMIVVQFPIYIKVAISLGILLMAIISIRNNGVIKIFGFSKRKV